MMKKISTILLAVLTLTVTACGGSGGESGDSAQDRAVERYAELLEGVGAQDVNDFSACVLPVLKETSGLSWDDIATRLDNSSTFEDSEEQFDDVPDPDDKDQATLLACFAELSEDDLQKIILGETVAADAPEVSRSVSEIADGIVENFRETGALSEDQTAEEVRTWAECTATALLNAGFSEDELYDHFIGGAWREDIFDERTEGLESSQCFTEFMFGPSVEMELPDGDLFELAVTEYPKIYLVDLTDLTPAESEGLARCVLTRIRDAGFSDEDIWRYAVDDYSSGAPSRVLDADVATWDCFDLLYTDE